MCEQKGLKIVVDFTKEIDKENIPHIRAKVRVVQADGLSESWGRNIVLQKALSLKDTYTSTKQLFDTATEAENWASLACESIKREYRIEREKVESLRVPEGYEVFVGM